MNTPEQIAERIVIEWYESDETVLDKYYKDAITTALRAQQKRVEELEATVRNVTLVWNSQCGRVFESMGRDNPRALAIEEAVDSAAELLRKEDAK